MRYQKDVDLVFYVDILMKNMLGPITCEVRHICFSQNNI